MNNRDRSAEDSLLSRYSLIFKYQERERLDANLKSLAKPIEAFRLMLDLRMLRRYLKGPKVLDFPLGSGRLYPLLIDEYELYGFDISEFYVERAQIRYPHLAERFRVNSFESMEVPVMQFNSVYTMRVINQINDRRFAVRNVARLLEPGGRWLVNLARSTFRDPVFSKSLEENGFKVIALHPYDTYSSYGDMPPSINRIYGSTVLRLVSMGLMPKWGFRVADWLFARHGQYFMVAERQ